MTFAGSERKEPSAMDMGLRNAAVFVTGGNRGIGRAIAIGFAQEGARVANCGRDGDALDETRKAIDEAMGGRCVALQTNLSEEDACAKVVQRTFDAFYDLDC